MDSIIGSAICEFTGAVLKWFFYRIYAFFTDKKPIDFKEIWGDEKKSKHHELVFRGFSNVLLGFAFYFILLVTLIFVIMPAIYG